MRTRIDIDLVPRNARILVTDASRAGPRRLPGHALRPDNVQGP